MKSVRLPKEPKKRNDVTRTIEKCSKGTPLESIRDNIAASHSADFKGIGPVVKEYLKCATEAGIVKEVKGKTAAGFYMVNVSLESRVFRSGNKKKRVPRAKKHRSKVNKSSFDQRNSRSTNELLYI